MKTFYVPLSENDNVTHVLGVAFDLAARFEGHVVAGAVRSRLLSISDEGLTPALEDQFRRQDDERRDRLRVVFDRVIAEKGIALQGDRRPSAAWTDEEHSVYPEFIGAQTRIYDLAVMGRPPQVPPELFESILFEGGRPALLVPRGVPAKIGVSVAIAWNGSVETARTIALAMPILQRASAVTVVSVAGWGVPSPGGEELTANLRVGGIPASHRRVETDGLSNGEAILREASRLNADLLIKGAYTQSRLRQLLFGGATRHIIDAAQIPVLMAH